MTNQNPAGAWRRCRDRETGNTLETRIRINDGMTMVIIACLAPYLPRGGKRVCRERRACCQDARRSVLEPLARHATDSMPICPGGSCPYIGNGLAGTLPGHWITVQANSLE